MTKDFRKFERLLETIASNKNENDSPQNIIQEEKSTQNTGKQSEACDFDGCGLYILIAFIALIIVVVFIGLVHYIFLRKKERRRFLFLKVKALPNLFQDPLSPDIKNPYFIGQKNMSLMQNQNDTSNIQLKKLESGPSDQTGASTIMVGNESLFFALKNIDNQMEFKQVNEEPLYLSIQPNQVICPPSKRKQENGRYNKVLLDESSSPQKIRITTRVEVVNNDIYVHEDENRLTNPKTEANIPDVSSITISSVFNSHQTLANSKSKPNEESEFDEISLTYSKESGYSKPSNF